MRRLLYRTDWNVPICGRHRASAGGPGLLTGTVKDSSGAVVPGATVTVTETAGAVSRHHERGGDVSAPQPDPRPLASCPRRLSGFQKSSRNVILEIGQKGRVDFTLGVGGASETVTRRRPGPAAQHRAVRAGHGDGSRHGGEPAPRHPQLGRPARARAGRAGRSLHRSRAAARPSAARAAINVHGTRSLQQQLPPRRRGQQQHLGERAGADQRRSRAPPSTPSRSSRS